MGQKYASYNSIGAIIAYYDSIDSPPPSVATTIPITDDEWQNCLHNNGYTIVNGALTAPAPPTPLTDAQLLSNAQSAQIQILQASYQKAINSPISFTNAAGVTSTYPSGNTIALNGQTAAQNLSNAITAGSSAWITNLWLDSNNIAQKFTFADLEGLSQAMQNATSLDWSELITKIAAVQAATSIQDVQSVTF